jgi:hypothetical protein
MTRQKFGDLGSFNLFTFWNSRFYWKIETKFRFHSLLHDQLYYLRVMWRLAQDKFNKELQGALFDDSDSLFKKLFESQLNRTDLHSALLDALA